MPSLANARARASQLAVLLAAVAAWFLMGCASIPKGASAVDSVSVEGTNVVDSSDIENAIATIPSPKFLFLFRGVIVDYELFDRYVLERDLERIERFYRARGFYEAHVRAGRITKTADNHVRVNIEVEEGLPVVVRNVTLGGTNGLAQDVIDAAQKAARKKLKPTRIFDEDEFTKNDEAVRKALTDRGYAYAQSTRRAEVDLPHHTVDIFYEVFPGPPSKFGAITIEGLGNLPEAPIRRALALEEGQEYSTLEIQNAQQAVLDLGAFSSVILVPSLPDPPPAEAIVPVTVKLEQAKLRQITLGGGFEFDPIKTDVHLISGWENRNFLGGFRKFSVKFTPGVVLYPTRFQTPLEAPQHPLPEEKLKAEFRQPGFIEARTGGLLRSELNTYPLLLTPEQANAPGPVLGYFEYKGAAGVDRQFWKLYASPTYNFQTDVPFVYLHNGAKDETQVGPIVISYVDLLTQFDFRNDKIHPHSGIYLANDLQVAGLGGDARDLRIQPEVRGYIPLGKKVTFGMRGTVGFLFPSNYDHPSQVDPANTALVNKDTQLSFFRGFFSGGPNSNRGYPLRGVGPHGIIPFFNPGLAYSQIAKSCAPGGPPPGGTTDANTGIITYPDGTTYDPNNPNCKLPIGGFTLWELSAEVRFPISGPLTGATFCDASDVAAEKVKFRFNRLHLSCGLGARYDTPVGPIRLDLGYRIPGMQYVGESDDAVSKEEGPTKPLFGVNALPIAIAFGIGEAF